MNMQNLENLDFFCLNFDYTKTAKMPEGTLCQIRAQMKVFLLFKYFAMHNSKSFTDAVTRKHMKAI